MKKIVVLAAFVATLSAFARVQSLDAMSDDEYKEFLVTMTAPRCGNGGGGLRSISPLPDTNRFLRLVKEVAHSNTNRTSCMIVLVAEYGSEADLPFLYEYAADSGWNGRVALKGILEHEGISSNSATAVETFLATTDANRDAAYNRSWICRFALREASRDGVTDALRSRIMQSVLSYALRDGSHVAPVDGYIMAFDPAYQYSTNRLEILRASLGGDINDYQRNYVTNAIHEIEAQLPPE